MADILIIDDERDVVSLMKYILEKDGHKVSVAHEGAEALALMGVEPASDAAPLPQLIILDVMMPVMDGYTVCTKLAASARARSIPVLILTAKGATRDLFGFSPNVAAHLEKPFDPKRLRELVMGMMSPGK